MKAFLSLLISIAVVSCRSPKQEEPNTAAPRATVIAGTIKNSSLPEIQLVSDELLGQQKYNTSLNEVGEFQLSFPMGHAHDVLLIYDQQFIPLYLHPGDSIYLTTDANRLTNVAFSGDTDQTDACLSVFMPKFAELIQSKKVFTQASKLSPTDFKAVVMSLRSQGDSLVSETEKQYTTDRELTDWMNNYVTYWCVEFLYKYGEVHTFTGQSEEEYYSFLSEYTRDEPNVIVLSTIRMCCVSVRSTSCELTLATNSKTPLLNNRSTVSFWTAL